MEGRVARVAEPATDDAEPTRTSEQAALTVEPHRSWDRPRLIRGALLVSWLVFAVAVQLARSARQPLWNVIWAEDGRFLYGEARAKPWSSTLFEPLAGYLQVVARFWSAIAAQFPVEQAALVISVTAALTAALLSVYVYVASGDVLPRTWQRCAVAALVVLHPATGYEVNSALNNVHWYLLFAAFWACVGLRTSRRRLAADTVVVVLATLSDPLALLLLPVAIFRAVRLRARLWVLGGLVVSLVLQYALAISQQAPTHGHRHLEDLPLVYAFRVASSFLIGDEASRGQWNTHGAPPVVMMAAIVVTGFAVALSFSTGRQRRLLATLLGYSVLFLVASLTIRGGAAGYLTKPAHLPGSRYTIIPLWMLYSALIVAAGVWPRDRAHTAPSSKAQWTRIVLPAAALLLIGAQFVANFAPPGVRSGGSSWHAAVADARQACREGVLDRRVAGQLPNGIEPVLIRPNVVAVPVAPYGKLFWAVRLHCGDL